MSGTAGRANSGAARMTSKTEFDRFVERQQAQSEDATSVDPKQQLQEWRDYLNVLYDKIKEYMCSYINNGAANITLENIILNEEFSGPYTVQQMRPKIGRSSITFKPIGTMLIGSKGRVDVRGPRGSARLGLVNKHVMHASDLIRVTVSVVGAPQRPPPPKPENQKIEWAWKIITSPPQMSFTDLTRDVFFDLILSIADV
jgi:hypothetical protein